MGYYCQYTLVGKYTISMYLGWDKHFLYVVTVQYILGMKY